MVGGSGVGMGGLGGVGVEGTRGSRCREGGNSNSNPKTLFYKDCSLGSVKKPV